MENALRYHAEIDLSQKQTSHAQLVRLVGRNKDVLEVGPATGYVTKILQERGCFVWCIEIDPEAAAIATPFCERMVVDNIETMDLLAAFPKERFDVVTFGDVLEHLVNPLAVLARVKDLLKPGGCVIASVPNVAHGSIRLSLLAGRFEYLEAGLLDRTHLRFFTRESLADLFQDAGYRIRSWRRVLADPFATEVELREEDYPPNVVEAARADVESQTYQIVLKAYPARSTPNGRAGTIPGDLDGRNLIDDLWRWQNEKNEELRQLIDELRTKEESLVEAKAILADREALLAQRERSLHEANEHLVGLQRTTGYRLLEAYRRRTSQLFPPRSLRGIPYRALVSAAKRLVGLRTSGRTSGSSAGSFDQHGERSDGR